MITVVSVLAIILVTYGFYQVNKKLVFLEKERKAMSWALLSVAQFSGYPGVVTRQVCKNKDDKSCTTMIDWQRMETTISMSDRLQQMEAGVLGNVAKPKVKKTVAKTVVEKTKKKGGRPVGMKFPGGYKKKDKPRIKTLQEGAKVEVLASNISNNKVGSVGFVKDFKGVDSVFRVHVPGKKNLANFHTKDEVRVIITRNRKKKNG